ncbi:MAG: DUF1415 domain-containing protein [Bacteroidota bacterium]
MAEEDDIAIHRSQAWIKTFVLGMGLCPFAKPAWDTGRIYYQLCMEDAPDKIIEAMLHLWEKILNHSQEEIETAILILPAALADFEAYLDMLEILNELLEEAELAGVLQIASFHPDYQFEGILPHAAENFTNRSPYPMFHILREVSVSAAVRRHPNVEQVPERNIQKMEQIGTKKIKALLKGIWDNPEGVLSAQ